MLTPLALALLPLVASAGEGVYAFDDAWERMVPLDAPALSRGKGTRVQGVLRMAAPPVIGDGTWMAPLDIDDGLVRARFVAGAKLDVTLLVRAGGDAGPDADFETGYGVAIEPARAGQPALLRLYRYEHRQPRLLGAEAKLDKVSFAQGTQHELVVTLHGPFIDATLMDGVTLEPRARVIARDRLFAKGRVGVRFARSQDVEGGMSWLTVGTTTQAEGHELARHDEGAGPERLVILPASQEPLLPPDVRKLIVMRPPGEIHVVTDPTGLERIRRAGVNVTSASSDLPWKYVDASLRKTLGKPPAPTSSGWKIDEGYKDTALVDALVRAYAAKFPHLTKLEVIGRSLEGREILALKISRNPGDDAEDEPALLLDGAHHGGELISTELALDAMQQLLEGYRRDPAMKRIVDNMAVWIVPLVNPDCLHRFVHFSREADRKNARDVDGDGVVRPDEGIDLYRNYPVRHGALGEVGSRSWPWHSRYRGTAAASEPEVQAMMALAERERFVASIDFHTNATQILVPYTDPGMTNPEPNEAWTVAEEIAAPLPMQMNGKKYTVSRNLYPVDGTAQDWFRFAHGTVALLVEAPTHNPQPYAKGRAGNINGTRGAWVNLATRVLDGPGVAGRVRDADGNAVAAEVIIEEMRPRMGEVWTARPRDGRFHRLLPALGSYTVRVRAPGFVDVTRRITVDSARTARVDVTLQRAQP
jgi:hypothetical protein